MIPLSRLTPAPADRVISSPNKGSRGGSPIRLIVLHATADGGSETGAESWMQNPEAQASAHLHIRRDGSVTRLVEDEYRAWHAGRSEWPGIGDVNSESLGWEIANRNDGREAYTDAQYRTVAHLLRHYLPQGLEWTDVVSHAQVAPGRKTDPMGWDWVRMWVLVNWPDGTPNADIVSEPLTATMVPPNLETIIALTPEVVREVARVRGLDPDRAMDYVEGIEAALRIMARNRVKYAKQAADLLAFGIRMAEHVT